MARCLLLLGACSSAAALDASGVFQTNISRLPLNRITSTGAARWKAHGGEDIARGSEQGGGTLTLATWNVLSVSKCEMSANGFVGMQRAAFKAHNEGCLKGCLNRTENKDCTSTWLQQEIPRLFKTYAIDAMFVQEIDWPMLRALRELRQHKGYDHMPITGEGGTIKQLKPERTIEFGEEGPKTAMKKEEEKATVGVLPSGYFLPSDYFNEEHISHWLKREKMNEEGKPAGDFAYVVWDEKRVHISKCKQVGETTYELKKDKETPTAAWSKKKGGDMGKVGLCTIILKGGPEFKVLGMHGDGDSGFTEKQAALIPDEDIAAVLGDLNLHSAELVKQSVAELKTKNIEVPTDKQNTVYRVIHKYRKIVQSVQNSKILLGKNPFTCGNPGTEIEKDKIPWCGEMAELQGWLQEWLQGWPQKDKPPQYGDAKEAFTAATKKTDTNQTPQAAGKLKDGFLLMAFDNRDIWEKVVKEDYDWQGFPEDLGLDKKTLSATHKKATEFMTAEAKREDWVAFNSGMFTLTSVEVDHEKALREQSEVDKEGGPTVNFKYPVLKMASDHLPVIMKLKIKGGTVIEEKSKRAARVRSYRLVTRVVKKILGALVRGVSARS